MTGPGERRRAALFGRPLAAFLHVEHAAGMVLLAATVVALIWANSPLGDAYQRLWATEVAVRVGGHVVTHDLRHWVNDGLMALFFFTVGLEIKREVTVGELCRARTAALPLLAAVGGMVVPALVYLAFNPSGPARAGWAIPVATDIAFALGVLTLLGRRVPTALKAFLLTLAIADDIGAVVIIAVAYSSGIEFGPLSLAAGGLAAIFGLKRAGVWSLPPYALLAVLVWVAALGSGVHASLVGVCLGLLTPVRPLQDAGTARRIAQELPATPSPPEVRRASFLIRESVSVAERLQDQLHPWSSYVVLPLFALANAGIRLDSEYLTGALSSPITIGVAAGLAFGAPIGVIGFAWIALRLRLAELPANVGLRQLSGVGSLAGIGFTMSLFMAELAFAGGPLAERAKGGILLGSTLAALVGAAVFTAAAPSAATARRGRQGKLRRRAPKQRRHEERATAGRQRQGPPHRGQDRPTEETVAP